MKTPMIWSLAVKATLLVAGTVFCTSERSWADDMIGVASMPLSGELLIPLPPVEPPAFDSAADEFRQPVLLPTVFSDSDQPGHYPERQVVSLVPANQVALSQVPFEGAAAADASSGEQPPAGSAASEGSAGAPPAPPGEGAGNSAAPQTLGKAPPPNNNNLEFLRRQTVLLKPGEWQFDFGLTYTMFENTFPIALIDNNNQVVGVVQGRGRQRLATIPFELRYGVTNRIQAFCALPVGWANSEISFPGSETHDDIGGLADLRAGASFLVRHGCGWDPDVVATVAMTAPTGDPGPFSIGLAPGARLGEGYWGVSANLLWVHTLDPIILYYGLGYKHRFDAELSGLQVNPGEEVNVQLGVGFAVNPNVTLSSSFLGLYISQYEANGVQLAGSELEIARQRFSVTIARGTRIVEPFAEIGMTQDSPGYRLGVVWTF